MRLLLQKNPSKKLPLKSHFLELQEWDQGPLFREPYRTNLLSMRKAFITITVIALLLSIIGTGVLVYIDSHSPIPSESSVSGE